VYFAEVIKKIMNGNKPGNISFVSNKDNKNGIFINLKRAKQKNGYKVPEELKGEADKTISERRIADLVLSRAFCLNLPLGLWTLGTNAERQKAQSVTWQEVVRGG
jgi:hypothetical protein